MGKDKKEVKKTIKDEELTKKVVNKESYIPKKKLIKVKFKNFTKVGGKMYHSGKIVQLESISGFEHLVSIIE